MEQELTFGQKAVGLNFNHGEGEIHAKVHKVKQLSADLIDILNAYKLATQDATRPSWSFNIFYTAAFNAIIAAQMAAVKCLTWKD